jgi:hypothetical protein
MGHVLIFLTYSSTLHSTLAVPILSQLYCIHNATLKASYRVCLCTCLYSSKTAEMFFS